MTKTYEWCTDDIVGIMWHWHQHQWHYMAKYVILHFVSTVPLTLHDVDASVMSNEWKSQVASCFDHLALTNTMVILMVPSVSCDANTCMSQTKKSCPHFNHLKVINKMMPLTMPSVSGYAHTEASSITWLKVISCLVSIVSTKWTRWFHWWCS